MIKPEDIEIRSAKYKTLDNGACGVEVGWTTPDLTPNVKFNYIEVMEGIPITLYLFHGTNAEILDDFLVRGTFFTHDLITAIRYGKTIYAIELNAQSRTWFKLTNNGNYRSLGRIPLSRLIKLVWRDEND